MTSRVDDAQFQRALKEKPEKLFTEWRHEFGRLLTDFDAQMQVKRLRGRPGVRTRSGYLRRSFNHTVHGSSLRDLVGIYFTNAVYAPIHEYGGTIKAKPGKFLAIPRNTALNPSGVARGAPRDFPDTFFIRSSSGRNLFLVQRKPNEKLTILFRMVKQVTIPPRLGLRDEWTKVFRPRVVEKLRQATRRALA